MHSQRTAQQTQTDQQGTLGALTRLPGAVEVRAFAGGYSVAFPEADFVITMSSARPEPRCETSWEVTVRETQPGLSTWWGRWHRSFTVHHSEAGPLIAEELRDAMSRVRCMLDDRARQA
jgi:hypothetical protein